MYSVYNQSTSGRTICCLSCKVYTSLDAVTCEKCSYNASRTERELRREIADLNDKASHTERKLRREIADLNDKASKTEEELRREIADLNDKASKTEEELRREIADLKSKITFLSFLDHDRPPNYPSVPHGCPGNNCAGGGYGVPAFLVADCVPVPVHRAVLASRSPVFKAMLENEMEESRSGTIKITDATTEVLKAFVGYLYTAEAMLDEHMASDLLVLAEKYQVKHLKDYCEKFLVSTLKWESSVVNYSFAHQHNAKLLLDASLCLITDNMEKLTNLAEYRELVEKDARLVIGIYEFFLSNLF